MTFKLPTESNLGTYDRNQLFLVTYPDGTQKLFPRSCKHPRGQVAPLSWWKKCGFVTDERDLWAKSIMYPEHAQIMKRAGIAPTDLFNTLLSPSETEDVLQWFNVYRFVYGANPSRAQFSVFVRNVESCTGYRTKNPLAVGAYVRKIQPCRLAFNTYSFTIGHEPWIDAVCTHLESVQDNDYLASAVKALMQVGATTEAIQTIAHPRTLPTKQYAPNVAKAVGAMFSSGEFDSSAESYANTRLLAEIMTAAPFSTGLIKDFFFNPEVDREKLHRVVVIEGVKSELNLTAIFREEVPTALVGGVL